jgi:hypothetical protein
MRRSEGGKAQSMQREAYALRLWSLVSIV